MTVFKVIGRIPVGENTAIVVDGKGNLFHNGVGILDENGKSSRCFYSEKYAAS